MSTFSLIGQLKLIPAWVDGTITDSTTVVVPAKTTNGTGTGQANAYWRDVIAIAASATATVDLRNLSLAFYGATGSVSLASVKQLLIVNKSDTASLSVGGSTTNRWTALAAGAVTVGASGSFYALHGGSGYATTATDKVIAITNNGSASATIEIYVVGVKA